MGLGSRIFIVNDDGSLKRLSMARFERLFRRDLDERLSHFAGKRVKYAHVLNRGTFIAIFEFYTVPVRGIFILNDQADIAVFKLVFINNLAPYVFLPE